jgi:hypothetical protein
MSTLGGVRGGNREEPPYSIKSFAGGEYYRLSPTAAATRAHFAMS